MRGKPFALCCRIITAEDVELNRSHAQRTHGTSRNRRRQQDGGPAWFRPYCRAQRALTASIRLLGSTLRTVRASARCAHRRPVRTSRALQAASGLLIEASARMARAAEALAETSACIAREADPSVLPDMLARATEQWIDVDGWLQQAADDVYTLQADVLLALRTGFFVPEPEPAGRRPRIHLAPRPVPIRAFLRLRQPRVVDRIAPILRRRRRTPRPAAVRVPRRSLLGRAPPLFPLSLL